ncbi:MAG: preprotein translocase subunit SecY [bacterium]|nr:preprotein translocase subunit SecY [bacterium]
MENFWNKISLVWNDKELRGRVLFVLAMLVLFRFISNIPIPGVDILRLKALFSSNQFFGLLNVFSGGGLNNLSIMMLGVGPYITSSIIMQLLTMIFPSMKEMYQEEGEAGRRKFAQYSRILSVPLAMLQAFGFLALLSKQGVISASLGSLEHASNVFIITAGSVLLMWIGELINEYGIGNGVSLIIFSGIVSQIPTTLSQMYFQFDATQIPLYLAFLFVAVVTIAAVVVITEAERPIPVTYAKRVRGSKVYGGTSTYIPLRLNQAGVIPIIFALSILLFPQMIAGFLASVDNATVAKIASLLLAAVSNQMVYGGAYFLLVILFTYFYTAVTFDPDQMADNLQKGGAFIPGVRPGHPTSEYIGKIITRLTLFGSVFLGFIAILPLIMTAVTGNQSLAIGGTALLIVVSVVVELIKQVDAQVAMREY